MTPHYADDAVTLYHGDCLDVLRALPDASVDAVVTDPPYGLGFMGREWDAFGGATGITDPEIRARQQEKWGKQFGASARPAAPAPGEMAAFQSWCNEWATECLRVLKPGGHMLAFGGTRTWHRLACAIEDAGFEIRDSIAWLYGSGFPKSLDVSKAIDKAAGAEREVPPGRHEPITRAVGIAGNDGRCVTCGRGRGGQPGNCQCAKTSAPATADAQTWAGWGTALKPAHEPVVVARKPLTGTVAANVLAHGTGALNVDACRIDSRVEGHRTNGAANEVYGDLSYTAGERWEGSPAGRWPANVILDPAAAAELDRQSGERPAGSPKTGNEPKAAAFSGNLYGAAAASGAAFDGYADTGGASRFFYVPKANSSERPRDGATAHPTVKPLDLMRWLVRLVTPPGGIVLDPFAGSGTTAEACIVEGFRCITIEREDDYLPLILQRIRKPIEPVMF